MSKHTDSVEAHESLVYEVKQQILWDYSYYVSREQSVNGYWKRVSSIDDIPLHAIGSYKTHPVEEPDNLFLFKVYQYLLTQSQQVEEARETGYREGFSKASELAHEAHQEQVEEAVLQADATGAYHSGYLACKAEVEEAVRKRNGVIKEYKDEGVMFVLKVEDGKTYEASMPIPKWAEVGKITMRTPNHQD